MSTFVRIASTEDIPQGKLKAFEVNHVLIVVAHTVDGFYAVADECTHDSEPIHTGRIRGNEIMCSRHGARFDLKTGAVTAPPAVVPIDTYELKIEGEEIFVRV
ncbi:MAG: Rieske 2Fe-2S domain-containing protein [candidate division Zixibacteria bacterium]|nr:Rieske 2Fe-2S domain-containing protein [candidate division Zixibacteria bacterium]